MLEDDFNDVLSKAIRGLGANATSLGVDQDRLRRCLSGNLDTELIRTIAPQLSLNTEKLLALASYDPQVTIPANLKMFTSPFGHLGVNAYVVETTHYILIFDTGTDAAKMIRYITLHAPAKTQHIFITHEHPDHIECLADFPQAQIHHPTLQHGEKLKYDDISITVLDVAGHADPAIAYHLEGLESDICIVGDAIFAGSIGGCKTLASYPIALKNIREHLLTLPDATYLCSGHGGVTTVALEKANNPFL